MMEPKKAVSICNFLIFLSIERFKKQTVAILDTQRAGETLLPKHFSEHCHVIFAPAVNIQNSFVSEASCPDRERISSFVLLVGMIEYISDVRSPLIIDIDWHLTSREENTVDFVQQSIQLSSRIVIVERNNLSACHFEIFDIAGSDIGLFISHNLTEVFSVFGIDSDDWILRRKSQGASQQNSKQTELKIHRERFTIINQVSSDYLNTLIINLQGYYFFYDRL